MRSEGFTMDGTMGGAQRLTVAEFFELPDQRWTSLVDGEVVVNAPRDRHQLVAAELWFSLTVWCRAAPGRGLATWPLGVVLDDRNYYEPDVLWFRAGREPRGNGETLHPLPDVAVEVRSPSTWRYDIGPKKRRYEQHGLPEL